MKKKVHMGHLGINSSLRRARYLIFWPGMSTDIREYVETCGICSTYQDKQPLESLYVHETPELSWQNVGTDLFFWAGKYYMVNVDYASSFFELDYLPNTTFDMIVGKLKHHIARHGRPEYLISDYGPQYTSSVMKKMLQQWGIAHHTSYPGNSQAYGVAEASMKTDKRLLRKCKAASEDPYLGLLNVPNTPKQNIGPSPAQILLGRRTNTLVPTLIKKLKAQYDVNEYKNDAKANAYENVKSRDLTKRSADDNVRIQPIKSGQNEWREETVDKALSNSSYIVKTSDGRSYQRNRR